MSHRSRCWPRMILLLYQSASTAQLCFWLHAAGDAMRDAARVMEAALERIAAHRFDGSCHAIDPRDCFDVYEEVARAALVEVRALPASNTEAWCESCGEYVKQDVPLFRKEAYWKARAEAAEARLAQIAELVDDALPAEYAGNVYVDAEHYRSIQRLARGEEASE
jgi:hypothetical protein